MSEQIDDGATPVEPVGHPQVDQVLESLQGLGERPLDEHVAVFEAAHDALRAALSDAGSAAERPAGG